MTLSPPRRPGLRWLLGLLLILVALTTAWTWWAEAHSRTEREVRTWVHDQLRAWFPAAMNPDDVWHGLHRRAPASGTANQPPVAALSLVLIHGLDEPGDIWDDLAPALTAAGYAVWEYRYPNDQGIDRSADWLVSSGQPCPPARRWCSSATAWAAWWRGTSSPAGGIPLVRYRVHRGSVALASPASSWSAPPTPVQNGRGCASGWKCAITSPARPSGPGFSTGRPSA